MSDDSGKRRPKRKYTIEDPMTFFDRDPEGSLEEERRRMAALIQGRGGVCRACGRYGKITPKAFNRTMLDSLVWIASQSEPDGRYVNVPDTAPSWVTRTNQHATVERWGLVERMPHQEEAKAMARLHKKGKRAGFYRVTHKGADFLAGRVRVPSAVCTFNDTVYGWAEDLVSVSDVYGTHFDYAEMMRQTMNDVR